MAKQEGQDQQLQDLCTTALNYFRWLMVYLQPIVPDLAARSAEFLQVPALTWKDTEQPLHAHQISKFKPLLQRVEMDSVNAMLEAGKAHDPIKDPVKEPATEDTSQNARSTTLQKSICGWRGLIKPSRSRAPRSS